MLTCPQGLRLRLLRRCWKIMARRPPNMCIGDPAQPYMRRWHLLRSPLGGLYIHQFLRDDDDRALHDHPWPSLSVLLDGELVETYAPVPARAAEPAWQYTRPLPRGAVVWRGARFAHRLALPRDQFGARPALTLFFTGPKVREWGFWCPKASPAGGWLHWRDFVAVGNPGAIGPGCDSPPTKEARMSPPTAWTPRRIALLCWGVVLNLAGIIILLGLFSNMLRAAEMPALESEALALMASCASAPAALTKVAPLGPLAAAAVITAAAVIGAVGLALFASGHRPARRRWWE